jgi:hypothetical protein
MVRVVDACERSYTARNIAAFGPRTRVSIMKPEVFVHDMPVSTARSNRRFQEMDQLPCCKKSEISSVVSFSVIKEIE